VKLVVPERESAALRAAVADRRLVSSELAEVEFARAIRRVHTTAESQVAIAVGGLSLLPLNDPIRRLAGTLGPASLRTLDAVHLATALTFGEFDEMIAYDQRLIDAARNHGLAVLSPA
jgi:predicted nucleic acid-binding protein